MESEPTTIILQCIDNLKGSGELAESASRQLEEIISEPGNASLFFAAASLSKAPYQRKYCYTLLHRMFTARPIQNYLEIEGFIETFQKFALESLNSETDIEGMYFICDLVRIVCQCILKEGSWPEIFQISLELSQLDNERAAGGLYLMESVFGSASDNDRNQLFVRKVNN